MTTPPPDVALAEQLFRRLHELSFDGFGVTRDAYGPGEQAAHDLVRRTAEDLKLEISVDHAGNLAMTLPGQNRARPALLMGSHLDSVVHGGDYDGPAGVCAGLACLAGWRAADRVPGRDLTVLVTRAEEAGAWFAVSFPGSRAALGTLRPDALEVHRRDTGYSLAAHMTQCGFDPDAVRAGKVVYGPHNVAAFLEVHIEQGPVLDASGLALGIVTGTPGSRRRREAVIRGEENHSGATPRAFRRDAAIAAAELAYRLDQRWCELAAEGHELVCTFCVLRTDETAAFTKIAGKAHFELDMRSLSLDSLELMNIALDELVAEIATSRRVSIDLGPQTGSEPCQMDSAIQNELEQACLKLGVSHRRMASGGGHDAGAFAQAGVSSGMLFVRNQNGSHHPGEAMRMADFACACAVAAEWLYLRQC